MYPFVRMIKELVISRGAPPLPVTGTHVSYHRCWPWDIDMWRELNNGRTLTLYDLGRIPLALRTGLAGAMARHRWAVTMAGASVRYRRRVRSFDRLEMRSRLLCWDARFLYLEQSMWRADGECASHVLFRAAVTDAGGLVSTDRVLAAMGLEMASPPMPDWVANWIAAEDTRPWPPMQEGPSWPEKVAKSA